MLLSQNMSSFLFEKRSKRMDSHDSTTWIFQRNCQQSFSLSQSSSINIIRHILNSSFLQRWWHLSLSSLFVLHFITPNLGHGGEKIKGDRIFGSNLDFLYFFIKERYWNSQSMLSRHFTKQLTKNNWLTITQFKLFLHVFPLKNQ